MPHVKFCPETAKVSYINVLKNMGGSNKFRQGGPESFFNSSTYFLENHTDLPRVAIGPKGSKCFLRGVCTSISKKHIAT